MENIRSLIVILSDEDVFILYLFFTLFREINIKGIGSLRPFIHNNRGYMSTSWSFYLYQTQCVHLPFFEPRRIRFKWHRIGWEFRHTVRVRMWLPWKGPPFQDLRISVPSLYLKSTYVGTKRGRYTRNFIHWVVTQTNLNFVRSQVVISKEEKFWTRGWPKIYEKEPKERWWDTVV